MDKSLRPCILYLSRKFLIIISLFFTIDSFSANSTNPTNKDTVLIAKKADKYFIYKIGCHLSVHFNNPTKRTSGQLYHVSNDSISLINKGKFNTIKKVAINDIISITILHKETRKNWLIYITILSILMTIGLIYSTQGKLVALPFLILPVLSIFTYIPLLLFSFLTDIFSKKSIKKGWTFSSKK